MYLALQGILLSIVKEFRWAREVIFGKLPDDFRYLGEFLNRGCFRSFQLELVV